MKVCVYAKEYFTNEKNETTNKYYFSTSFRNKETGIFEVKNHVVFSSEEYNIGDMIEVSRSKGKDGKYFIPNKK